MRVVLLAIALLSSAAFGEQCLCFVKQTRLSTLYFQPPSVLLILLRRTTGARHTSIICCASLMLTISRVQFTTNTISWQFTQGDPSSVDIIINNANNATLNGNFSIARAVPVSQEVHQLFYCSLIVLIYFVVLYRHQCDTSCWNRLSGRVRRPCH